MKIKQFSMVLFSLMLTLALVMVMLPQTAMRVQAEAVSLVTPLEGKTLSVLGDSISTFNGVSNTTAAETTNSTIADGHWYYPAPEVSTVDMTWWMQTANALGMKLLVNNSWSGSYIFKERTYTDGSGVKGAYVDRCVQLHDDTGENAGETPDIIAIYLGTNDFKSDNSHIGTYAAVDFDTLITRSEGTYTYATPTTSMEAYAICLHKISQRYPDAEVYCFTLLPREVGAIQPADYSADIAKMAEHFGCYVVDLYNECGIVSSDYSFKLMMRDNLHPAFGGMQAISSVFTSAILRNSRYLSADAQVYDVSYTLDNVLTTGGKPTAVLSGQPLELKLAAGAADFGVDQVTVTMGGQDITADCYADGVISIPAVTGDVTVTANAKRTIPLHDHICDNCDANTNWQVWDGTVSALEKGGHFFLAGDTTMSGQFSTEKLANNQDLNVTICLNGHTLYGSAKGRMFRISNGSKLSIVDCTAKTEDGVYTAGKLIPRYHGIRAVVAGIFDVGESEFNLYDGIIDGGGNNNNSTVSASNIGGGLIDITGPDAEVNLYGGVLKDYSSYYGGAVYCSDGLVSVDGATIQNCNATRGMAIMIRSNGEGVIESGQILGGDLYHGVISVRDKGKLTINGGKIGDAFGKYAYGVHMMTANTSVTMTGGEISGNALQGVWVENGIFTMTGGEIKNNLCGIAQDGGTVDISGGKIVDNTAMEDSGIRHNAGSLFITGGMFDTDVSAYVAEGYEQYPNGKVGLPCEHPSYKDGLCENCGEEDKPAYNGLVVVDGVWGYYEGGELQEDYTGLVPYGDILFYVENGILDFTYTGLVWHNDAWTYVANSQLTEGYTGLVWFNDNWFYTVDSVIDWTFTGLVPYEGNYFYVQNNLLDWSYTGLGYHDGGWYFIQNGLLQKEYSGLVYFNDNWFYVEEGVLTYQYFGMVEYEGNMFYVQASHLDWNYTGLGYHEGNWYYFQNALYTPTYNGLVDFNGATFYVQGGIVDWTVNGLMMYEGDLYYIVDSVFDNTYNGKAVYNGDEYDVVNGFVDL